MTWLIVGVILFLSYQGEAQTKTDIVRQISASAKIADIDPDLAVAIAMIESGLNPKAIGSLGEIGLFQLRPEYHSVIKGNIRQNILAGVSNLAYVKSRCESKYGDAWFVAHNYGPSCKLKFPVKTQYYKKVMREYGRIKTNRYLVAQY
jgi:soluble lytic murein transglycosylase-like protein